MNGFYIITFLQMLTLFCISLANEENNTTAETMANTSSQTTAKTTTVAEVDLSHSSKMKNSTHHTTTSQRPGAQLNAEQSSLNQGLSAPSDTMLPSKTPYHIYPRLYIPQDKVTSILDQNCEIALYNDYIRPIYERQVSHLDDKELHEKLLEYLDQVKKNSSAACFGYTEKMRRTSSEISARSADSNATTSVFVGYMECRRNKRNTRHACQCLDENNKFSGMHHKREMGKKSNIPFCSHPQDILDSCNYKEWKEVVGKELEKITSSLQNKPISHALIKTMGKRLELLKENIRKKYGNDEDKLRTVCFTEDFSLVCNSYSYCTCHQSKPHFHFKRSPAFDRCIPRPGSWCFVAGVPNVSLTRDECIDSSCQLLYPKINPNSSTLGNDVLAAPPSPPSSPSPQEPLPYRACNGYDGWTKNTDGASTVKGQTMFLTVMFQAFILQTFIFILKLVIVS